MAGAIAMVRCYGWGGDMSKTSEGSAAAISLRLHKGHASDLIHLFDAAGEQYSQARPGSRRREGRGATEETVLGRRFD